MKFSKFSALVAALTMSLAASSASALVVSASNDATALANALGGSGITISNATLSAASATGAGTFTGGAASVGFNSGVLLTTGTVNCAPGPNSSASCGGSGFTTSLKFDFTSDTGDVFFKYVFASEEYNEYVGSIYNDSFELLLNGVNIALLPGGAGAVSINNVNNNVNSSFYRNNSGVGSLNLDTQYDGLTTVLIAQATGLTLGSTNTFEFRISDLGDSAWDSGVFIEAGTFSSTNPVPEPAGIALFGLGLLGLLAAKRRKA